MIESLEAISISVPILSSCWPSDDDFCVRELWQFPEDFSNDLRPHASLYLLLRLLKTLWFWKVQNLEDAWGVTLLFRSYFWLVLAGKNHTLICGSQFSKAFFDRWLLLTKLACKRRIDPITSSALHAMMILASYQRVWIASISDNHLLIETILCNVKSFLFGSKLIFEFFLLGKIFFVYTSEATFKKIMQNCHADSQNLSLGKIVDFHNFFRGSTWLSYHMQKCA